MYQAIYDAVMASLQAFTGPAAARMVSYVRSGYGVWAVVSICLLGLRVALGEASMRQMVGAYFRMVFVAAVALNPATYNGEVADRLWRLPDQVVSTMSSNPQSGSPARVIDEAIRETFATAKRFEQRAAGSGYAEGFWWHLCSGVVFLVALLVCGVAGFVVLAAKMGLSLTLAVGPLFLWAALYAPTRQMFGAWLSKNFGHIMTVGFVAVAVMLAWTIWNQAVLNTGGGGAKGASALFETGLAGVVCLGLVVAAAVYASHLTQGVQIAAAGVAASLHRGGMQALSHARGALGSLRPTNIARSGRRAGADVATAWRGAAGAAKWAARII